MNGKYLLLCFFILFIFGIMVYSKTSTEGYREPIYIDKDQLGRWYQHSNGSIYGFPHKFGGKWDVLRGFPYYDKAY